MRNLSAGYNSLIIACVLASSLLTVAQSQLAMHNGAVGGVSQIVETRNGRTLCRGVMIQLRELTLKDTIESAQLAITEAKHGSDLKRTMTWSIEDQGKRLVVKFEPGKGDFGSDNYITVAIRGSAFVTEPQHTYVFEISTDVL